MSWASIQSSEHQIQITGFSSSNLSVTRQARV